MAEQTVQGIVLFRRDTSADWETNKTGVPKDGEPCWNSETHELRVGDGVTAYENLPVIGAGAASTATHYEGTREGDETDTEVIERVLSGASPNKDDIFVVKTLISGDKYSFTAYVYNGTAWAAMDGNYNAENVYFDEDLLTTSEVGHITLTNGQATIPSTGKNLKEVFQTIYVKEKNPTITQPSVSLTFAQAKAYEVGESVTPQYSASLNPGSYQYGPATGVTATEWQITDTAGHSASTASGQFDPVVVADDTNYTITAQATHGAGATPKTNVGNDYAAGAIQAGTKSKTSSAITGYRNSFYGTVTAKETVTSAIIRGLAGKSGKALANGATFNVPIPVGALRVIIAYPATLRDVTSIQDVNGMSAEIKPSFTQQTVQVEGANGATAIDYKVYTLDFASANDTANTYKVTV